MLGFIAKTVWEENGTSSLGFKPSCGLGAEISREIENERGCGMGCGLIDVGASKVGEFLCFPYSFALLLSLAQLAARLLTIATTMRSGFLPRLPSRCVRILGNVSTELRLTFNDV